MTERRNNSKFIKYRPKAVLAVLLFALNMIMTGMPLQVLAAEEMTAVGDSGAEAPKIKARSAAIYSLELGRVVYGKNQDEIHDPYSTTKVLTCYLALQSLDPEHIVTISEQATQVYEGGTTLFLKPGEMITVKDLVYGALLESGNDAAYALGEAVSGSEEAFAELMNETVKSWGCENTHFVNANGWKNDEHYTTASDMATIISKCFENEMLLGMSAEKTYTIPATNKASERTLKNLFLTAVTDSEEILGGKTGRWSDDDCSIVLEFRKEFLSGVIVLLKDDIEKRKKDVDKLIEFSEAVTPGFLVSDTAQIVSSARVKHGEKTKADLIVDGKTIAYPASGNQKDIKVIINKEKLQAPLAAGDFAGTYQVYANDKLVAERQLLVAEEIKTGWLPSYLYISNKTTKIILGIFAAFAAIILILRRINRRKRETRKRLREKYRAKH